MSGSPRLRFGHADARHLRIGKDHGGHCGVVVTQAVAVQCVLGGELCAIGGHVDELIFSGYIAGGIDARLRGAHAIINDDGPGRCQVYTGFSKPKGFSVRAASRRHKNPLGSQDFRTSVPRDGEGNTTIIGLAGGLVGNAADDFNPSSAR